MEDGEITADEFDAAVMQIGGTPVAVEAAKSVDTFEGAMGNAAVGVTSSIQEIVDKYKPFLTDFITGFGETAKSARSRTSAAPSRGSRTTSTASGPSSWPPSARSALTSSPCSYRASSRPSRAPCTPSRPRRRPPPSPRPALNAVLNANPFMVVVTLLGLLVGAFVTAWTTNEEFRNLVIATWNR